jgi:hypothetical protein
VIVRVDEPPVGTDVELNDVLRPVAVKAMVPAKPEMLAVDMVEVPELPGASDRLDGLAAIEKSCAAMVTGTWTVWVKAGLDPEPVTSTEPEVVPVTERVVLTVLSGGRNNPASTVLAVNPAVEVTVMVRKSVNPPKLAKVIVEVAVTPDGVEMDAGAAVTPKSVRLEKVAPCVFSLSGVPVPFDTVTESRSTLIPGVFETTL